MVKIDAEDSLVVKRQSIEDRIGRSFDLQELHINLITLTGHIDETDDELTLSWIN
jgi:phenol hydroxylase P2 protein